MENRARGSKKLTMPHRPDWAPNAWARTQPVGYTLWFTGLPASGKSTLARAVCQALLVRGAPSPEVLDGDEIRVTLSSGLGFSREDRMTNVFRIGWVAQLLTKHRIPVLVAAISPYRQSRNHVREMIEAVGGKRSFIEFFVDCPLEVCMSRDPKGLYAKARAGKLKNLSGFNDCYEAPVCPDLHLHTNILTCEETVECVMTYLEQRHLIQASQLA